MMYSPLAVQVPHRLDKMTRRKPWGLCLHTTGRGIVAKAKKTSKTPIEVALKIYRSSQDGGNGYPWGGPAYVIDHDGSIYQIAPDDARTMHVGAARALYTSGRWAETCSPEAVARWRAQWPGKKSPQHLFPSNAPNTDYVGCEMIACGSGIGTPMAPGLHFTAAQHDAAVALGRDLAERHGWPADWALTPRLVGHEDVGLHSRSDAKGGWDPGWLRAKPTFDFAHVRFLLTPAQPAG